ncbi:hypothetical protein RND71_003521 [Anisodus tanguticus]|uniref:U1-type domain-containing protein n=1 Tax=Anisodus tanguticus TaxID=243964 RepID=A0AAE1SWT4_9SOLA|nr:hypothetical protein RND71_003521 [Anisodus tanguticus]
MAEVSSLVIILITCTIAGLPSLSKKYFNSSMPNTIYINDMDIPLLIINWTTKTKHVNKMDQSPSGVMKVIMRSGARTDQCSSDVHEAMKREIEKECIREEIIAEEVARRRMLEFEVRRELMMEREVAVWRGDHRYASLSISPRFPFLKQQADAVSLVSGLAARRDMEQSLEVPFQRRVVEPKVSILTAEPEILQVQPSLDSRLREDSGILLPPRLISHLFISEHRSPLLLLALIQAKPDTTFSGAKRKAITPIQEVAEKPSLSSAPKKNVNEWRCAVCQVSATNQDGLNNHFQGKKHKRKEATLREQKHEKNCSIGFFPKKPKLIQLVESCDDMIPEKKSEEGSSGTNDIDAPSLLIEDSTDDLRKNANEEHSNRAFKFWCETCKIGTTSEKLMETHRIGKKHARRLQQLIGGGTSSVNNK